MECLPNYEAMCVWLTHYGSFALFGLLALGIIALPIPEETLLVIAGFLISHERLEAIPTIIAAYGGSFCGITVSYLLGRTAGRRFINSFGSWFGMTEAKMQQIHDWFETYGKWTLMFGYFVPGVRHFTGLCAGTSSLEYPVFALFAYVGGLLWVSTFLLIGYFVGDHWNMIYEHIEAMTDKLVWVAVMGLIAYILFKIFYRRSSS